VARNSNLEEQLPSAFCLLPSAFCLLALGFHPSSFTLYALFFTLATSHLPLLFRLP